MAKEKDNQDLFEITFYKNLLEKKPDFCEALSALGDLYTKNGLYEEGLGIDLQLVKLKPYDAIALYNLSCSYSLLGRTDLSLETLKTSIENGYHDFKFLMKDKDLNNLREDSRFSHLISSYKQKSSTK
jgi:tetratricopeptide (TPR) repeat protein